jgi:DegV family protein with EDD domain
MKIVTDSAADMPAEELRALGIAQAPLFIQFPEGEISSADITPDDFYDRLKRMYPSIPTTAQPSGGLFATIYRQIAETDRQILSIHISSGLSGTLNAARIGADQVGPQADVTVWDTLTLSGGERSQVLAAALAAQAGWTLPAIQQRLEEIRARTEIIFTLETMEYLARGGRIGRVQALAGALLNIKPVIHVEHHDGKYGTVTKVRTIPRALQAIAEYLQSRYADTPLWATVMHGHLAEQAEALAAQLRQHLSIAKLETLRVSPVLGVHTGPGVVGASVVPMNLMQDLSEPADRP